MVKRMKRKREFKSSKNPRPKKFRQTGDYQKGRELAKAPKQELKAFDVAHTSSAFAAGGTFTVLNTPVNGAELYQRVGRKIYMKSLQIRGIIQNTATDIQDMLRIAVVYDSQPNAALPVNLNAVFQDSNAGAATSVFSEINLINRQRFKILKDYQIMIPSVFNAAGVLTNVGFYDQKTESFSLNWFIKLRGLEAVFNATNGGTIADITSGSIFLVTFCSSATDWSFEFTSRLRYYD